MNGKRRDEILAEYRRKNEIPLNCRNISIFLVLVFLLLTLWSYVLLIFNAPEQNVSVTPTPTMMPAPILIAEPNAKQTQAPKNLGRIFKVAPATMARTKVTAYCPCKKCCGPHAIGKTSIGRDAWKTFGVAADPKLLPYRTKLEIPGIGIREVDDTGGAMRQDAKKGVYHIDIRFRLPDGVKKTPENMEKVHQEAKRFGVKWLDVKVLPQQQ